MLGAGNLLHQNARPIPSKRAAVSLLAVHLGSRWLLRRRSAWLATMAVILTVTVSIAVMGVMQGFVEVMDRQIRANESDLTLQAGLGAEGLEDSPGYRNYVRELDIVTGIAPSISGYALVTPQSLYRTNTRLQESFPAQFDGIEWDADAHLGRLPEKSLHRRPDVHLKAPPLAPSERGTGFLTPSWRERLAWQGANMIFGLGPLPLPPTDTPPVGVVVGQELAYIQGLSAGDGYRPGTFLTLSIPNARGGLVGKIRVEMSDTLGTGIYEVDRYNCLIPLPFARRLTGFSAKDGSPALVSAYRISVQPGSNLDADAKALSDHTGEPVETWVHRRQHLAKGAINTRNLLGFVMLLVQILAVFIVYASFSTLVIEKRRDLGALLGIGTQPRQIISAFIFAAIFCCVGGGLIGWGLGWAILAGLNPFSALTGFYFFPEDFNYSAETPISFNPIVPLLYITSMTTIGVIAALLPAWRASRIDPVAILREGG